MFGGTFSTGVACLSISGGQYRRFVVCKPENEFYVPALNRLRSCFVAEATKGSFGSIAKNDVQGFSDEDFTSSATLTPSIARPEHPSDAPANLPGYCALPDHILVFLETYTDDPTILNRLSGVPVSAWVPEI